MGFLRKFELHRDYIYFGSIEDFETSFLNFKNCTPQKLSGTNYKMNALASLGIAITNPTNLVEGINVKLTVTRKSDVEQIIHFHAGVRGEIIFIAVIGIVITIGIALSNPEPFWMPLAVGGSLLIAVLWFHFIYRLQEDSLVESAARKLRLKRM